LQLSEALLLAPKSDVVTRKENLLIALFEFIADTKVKLYTVVTLMNDVLFHLPFHYLHTGVFTWMSYSELKLH